MAKDMHQLISEALDALGQVEGSIVFRGKDFWEALPPGEVGQVLAVDIEGMPGYFWIEDLPTGP